MRTEINAPVTLPPAVEINAPVTLPPAVKINAPVTVGYAGKSNYEIALANGFDGSEQDWLESLKGDTGAIGPVGAVGATGAEGPPGGSSDFVHSYEPVQVFNPWGLNKYTDAILTNRFHGRGSLIAVSQDGQEFSETVKSRLFNSDYNSSINLREAGESSTVILLDFLAGGLTSVNGFTYASGVITIHFYYLWGPDILSARVRDRNGVWTDMNFEEWAMVRGGSWKGAVPIGNYITAIEFTLTPKADQRLGLTEIEYHGSRMSMTEGGAITKAGGSIYSDLYYNDNKGPVVRTPSGSNRRIIVNDDGSVSSEPA